MNQYLSYQIAQDRHAEFLNQAKANRRFDQQTRNASQRVVGAILIMLDGPSRYLKAATRAASVKRSANPTNFRPGMSG